MWRRDKIRVRFHVGPSVLSVDRKICITLYFLLNILVLTQRTAQIRQVAIHVRVKKDMLGMV